MEKKTGSPSRDQQLPPASVIVPSRGRPELLRNTVRSILDGDEVPAELIVLDQSEAADPILASWTTDRPCRLDYRWTPVAGVSRARNAGIAAAAHDILVFTDDDVLVAPDWFGSIVRALVRCGERSVVTGRVLPGPSHGPDGFAPSTKTDEMAASYRGRIGADVLFSGNMALHRSAFREVGLFDERLGGGGPFLSAEDNDLGFRLLESGYTIHYVPDATLHHLGWRTASDRLPLQWSYAYGQGAFYAKHASLRDRHMLGRFRRGVGENALACLRTLAHRRRLPRAEAVYAAGLVAGFTRWVLGGRSR